jgi:drug/metabolite transporter (DMT)-like permease
MNAEPGQRSDASTHESGHRWRVILAFGALYFAWGASFLVTRVGVRELPPFLFGCARFSSAGLIMLAYARWSGVRLLPERREWNDLAVLACFGFLISNGANLWAIQFLPSNQMALLNTTVPCWMVLLGAFGSRAHRPGALSLAGLAAGTAGAVLLIEPWSHAGRANLLPELVVVVGALGWAINSVYQRNMQSRLPVTSLIGWQMLLGGCLLGLTGVMRGEPARWHWQWHDLLPLSYLVIVASCVAHTSFAWLAPRTTPTSLSTYAYVNPLIATVLGWLVLDEMLSGAQQLGMTLVIGGVVIINWAVRRGR